MIRVRYQSASGALDVKVDKLDADLLIRLANLRKMNERGIYCVGEYTWERGFGIPRLVAKVVATAPTEEQVIADLITTAQSWRTSLDKMKNSR